MKTGDKIRTGGLNQTEVDARVTALVAADVLAERSGKLQKADGSGWEYAVDGTLYVAPSMFQHLGKGDIVYCQRASGSTQTGDVSIAPAGGKTVAVPLRWEANVKDSSGTDTQLAGWYSSASYICALKYSSATNTFILARGTSCDDNGDPWSVWVYFTAAA